MQEKECTNCKKSLSLIYFSKDASRGDGLQATCKKCRTAYRRRNDAKHKRYMKAYYADRREDLRSKSAARYKADSKKIQRRQKELIYGISWDDIERIYQAQGMKCGICRFHIDDSCWRIDHDHLRGEVRGVLCNSCNLALGLFKDSQEVLESAGGYLKAPPAAAILRKTP